MFGKRMEEFCILQISRLKQERLLKAEIDWKTRFMKMQQHTGEHIVSGIVHARYGFNNVGFHLGTEDCTMDFDGEISKEALQEIELKQIVQCGRI